MEMKPLQPTSFDTFCQIYTDARGEADITCPADDYYVSCLAALERRGLILWDTERKQGKTKRWCALTELGAAYACSELALLPSGKEAKRNRICVSVFLDLNNNRHFEAWEIIKRLKKKRTLTPVLIDGVIMSEEFLNKKSDTFAKAYPAMYKLMTETRQDDLIGKLESLLQNAPQSSPMPPVRDLQPVSGGTGLKSANGAPKQIAVKQFEVPKYDDDEDEPLLEIKKDEGASMRATMNFINSIKGLSESDIKADPKAMSGRQRARLEKD